MTDTQRTASIACPNCENTGWCWARRECLLAGYRLAAPSEAPSDVAAAVSISDELLIRQLREMATEFAIDNKTDCKKHVCWIAASRLVAQPQADRVREALEAAREYIGEDNNPKSNRVLHKILAALASEGKPDVPQAKSTPYWICCHCDAPLSCAACGVEQPDDSAFTKPQSAGTPADAMVAQVEERFPNWRSYRDLVDCIDCTLHQLRTEARK